LNWRSNWFKGVYFLAKSLKAGIVAIQQLPVNQDTKSDL